VKLEKEYLHIDDFGGEPGRARIAVIIPAFREENVLGRTLRRLVEAAGDAVRSGEQGLRW